MAILVADRLQRTPGSRNGRIALFHHVRHLSPGYAIAVGAHLLFVSSGASRKVMSTPMSVKMRARSTSLLEALGGVRIGARHDENVGARLAGIDGRLDPGDGFVAIHRLLAAGVTAAFGRHLILNHHTGESRARISAHRALHVQGIAVAGIAIADDRDRDRLEVSITSAMKSASDTSLIRSCAGGWLPSSSMSHLFVELTGLG